MEHNDKDALFTQVRSAHRLLAAYYQRLLPTIEQIAIGLDVDFYVWLPKEFRRPAQLSTNPFDRWQWDMLPGLSTYYLFKQVENTNKLRVGEYLVEFLVDSDSGVDSDIANGDQPDALKLPVGIADAKSTFTISIYVACKNQDRDWHRDIWNSCAPANLCEQPGPTRDVNGSVVSCRFEIPLAELLEEGAEEKVIKLQFTHIFLHLEYFY